MILLLPLAISWIGALILSRLDGRQTWVGRFAGLILTLSLASGVWLANTVVRQGPVEIVAGGWERGVGITLRADYLGVIFIVLANALLLVALLYERLSGVSERKFPALIAFLAAGMTGIFLTADAFNFYVFFEISMTAAFVLSSYGQQPREVRDTFTFVVTNLLGSTLFLGGVVGLYRLTGTLDMRGISVWVNTAEPTAVILVSSLIFVAFSIKLGLFPFHFWLPSVYQGVQPVVAAVLSGVLANIGSYGLLRFGIGILRRELLFAAPILFVIGAASILYGAILANSRRTLVETLAYSSISQAGYIVLALVMGGSVGYAAAVLYTIINAVNKTLLFLASGSRGWLVGAAVAIGAFSTVGLPPAIGFFGKAALFQAGMSSSQPVLALLVIFLGSGLSFVYMFQIYQRRFWGLSDTQIASPLSSRLLLLFVAGVVLLLGIWPDPLIQISQFAVQGFPRGVP